MIDEPVRVFHRDVMNAMRTPADQASLVSVCRIQRGADALRSAAERGDQASIDEAFGQLATAMATYRQLRAQAQRQVEAALADV